MVRPTVLPSFNICNNIFLASEFDPDRFIDERLKQYLTKNPFIFLPFNAGPRICLGQQVSVAMLDRVSKPLIELLPFSLHITKL